MLTVRGRRAPPGPLAAQLTEGCRPKHRPPRRSLASRWHRRLTMLFATDRLWWEQSGWQPKSCRAPARPLPDVTGSTRPVLNNAELARNAPRHNIEGAAFRPRAGRDHAAHGLQPFRCVVCTPRSLRPMVGLLRQHTRLSILQVANSGRRRPPALTRPETHDRRMRRVLCGSYRNDLSGEKQIALRALLADMAKGIRNRALSTPVVIEGEAV